MYTADTAAAPTAPPAVNLKNFLRSITASRAMSALWRTGENARPPYVLSLAASLGLRRVNRMVVEEGIDVVQLLLIHVLHFEQRLVVPRMLAFGKEGLPLGLRLAQGSELAAGRPFDVTLFAVLLVVKLALAFVSLGRSRGQCGDGDQADHKRSYDGFDCVLACARYYESPFAGRLGEPLTGSRIRPVIV